MSKFECPSTPSAERDLLSFSALPSIQGCDFSLHAPIIDRRAMQQALTSESVNLVYGDSISSLLHEGLSAAVERAPAAFYSMFDVTRATVETSVKTWLEGNPLGGIGEDLARALTEDICSDVCHFISATGSRSITLRLVLENESGCGNFLKLLDTPPVKSQTLAIENIVERLEYGAAFLLHCDEDMVNQIKSYVGAPTIALHHSQMKADPSLDRWFEIFRSGDPVLATAVENMLAAGNRLALEQLGQQLEKSMAKFQLEVPDLGLSGTRPFNFLTGRPHLYFGAVDKIEGKLGIDSPKGLLHARPVIWAEQSSARRFMAIMDTNPETVLEDLFG